MLQSRLERQSERGDMPIRQTFLALGMSALACTVAVASVHSLTRESKPAAVPDFIMEGVIAPKHIQAAVKLRCREERSDAPSNLTAQVWVVARTEGEDTAPAAGRETVVSLSYKGMSCPERQEQLRQHPEAAVAPIRNFIDGELNGLGLSYSNTKRGAAHEKLITTYRGEVPVVPIRP